MKAPVLERTSAAKAGWLIIALTLGWLVFLFLPGPAYQPAAKPEAIELPPSSLRQAGLRDYTDWEGLPEIFAIWADKAEWKENRTKFAYWHPVMKTYSYYFEAIRTAKGHRFREIAEPHEPDHFWDESLGEDCPIRFYLTTRDNKLNGTDSLPPSARQTMDSMKAKLDNDRVTAQPPDTKIIPVKTAPKP